jgi:multicomponent Na+:H+ antiporter subunit F
MLLALLPPIIQAFRMPAIWERLLCFTSVSTRAAIITLLFAQFRDDAFIAMVSVVVLGLGNSGLLLLAKLVREMETECN